MFGLIGRIEAHDGSAAEELASILADGIGSMPGCRSYVVAMDPDDPKSIWVTEVWDSRASHEASLALPQVQDAIRRGRPLIAGMYDRRETRPVGGFGL